MMTPETKALLADYSLSEFSAAIARALKPAVRFSLSRLANAPPLGTTRVGGLPDLPAGFRWPENKGRPLDYLLQVRLADLAVYHHPDMPTEGLLTFFFDCDSQPWGYDPADLGGFRVCHHDDVHALQRIDEVPDDEFEFPDSAVAFYQAETFPHYGTQAYEELFQVLPDTAADSYDEFLASHALLRSDAPGAHQFFGHSANIQGDMQLEAQLVTNGLFCGNSSGYTDPRAAALAAEAHQWQLLLQLDSDGRVETWGDCGMLYFWIRQDDLVRGAFDRVWGTLQCH